MKLMGIRINLLLCLTLLLPLSWASQTRLLQQGLWTSPQGLGSETVLHTWDTQEQGWAFASSYSLSALLPEERSLNCGNDLVTALGFGISFLHFGEGSLVPLLGLSMDWGTEEIEGQYRNFFMGGSTRQELSWFFSRRFGLVLTLGLYEVYHINSELYPWDLGTQTKIGLVF